MAMVGGSDWETKKNTLELPIDWNSSWSLHTNGHVETKCTIY